MATSDQHIGPQGPESTPPEPVGLDKLSIKDEVTLILEFLDHAGNWNVADGFSERGIVIDQHLGYVFVLFSEPTDDRKLNLKNSYPLPFGHFSQAVPGDILTLRYRAIKDYGKKN